MINISKSAQRIMSLSDKNIYFVSTNSTIFLTETYRKNSGTECLIILNSKAHLIWPKSAQKGAQIFPPKSAIFLVKSAQFFDPPINFYCIFMHKYFWRYQILHFCSIFCRFYCMFSLKKVFFKLCKGAQKFFKEPLDFESRTNVLQGAHY